MISRRSAVGLAVWAATSAVALLLLVAWVVVPWLLLNTDEAAVPPRMEVPPGVAVVRDTLGCASGGCWRDLELRTAGARSAAALAEQLGVVQGCEARNWLDRRRVCTGVEVTGDVVRVSQRYDPSQVL